MIIIGVIHPYLAAATDEVCCLVQEVAWRSKESNGNDDIEAEQHSALEVIRFAVLNGISDYQNGYGESDGLD